MATLSEHDSKELVAAFGVPTSPEALVHSAEEAAAAAGELGWPVVVKACGSQIAHKSERGLVRLGLSDSESVRRAAEELLAALGPDDGDDVGLLVAPMVSGKRELICGLMTDEQFGKAVMLGVGGILAEAIADVVFRLAPLDRAEANAMIDDLATQSLLGEMRGDAPVDREALVDVLVGLGRIGAERPDVASVDLNPLIVGADGVPVAVDALVEMGTVELAGKGAA